MILWEKWMVNIPKKDGRVSAAARSSEFRGMKQVTGTGEQMDDVPADKHISDYYITPNRPQNSDTRRDGGGPTDSAAYLRRWGKGVSVHNLQSESMDLLKQRHKTSTDRGFFSRKSFKELGCSDHMIEALKRQHFIRPSRNQAMAFSSVSEGKSCILADQSGSGKTLAYLLPLIQCLRQEELQGLSKSSSRSLRVVIVVPTAELASQVLSNCQSMSRFGFPFRSMVVTGGFRQRTQLENLQQAVDVLIATPDILFKEEDFEIVLQSLISSSPVSTQYLFVTATLPIDVYNKVVEDFPDSEVVMGPGMRRISPGLEEVLVDCSGNNEADKTPEMAFLNKKSALLQLIEESPVSKTIVFCNKIETCRKVENILKRFNRRGTRVGVLPFHAALEQGSRLANMKKFTTSPSKECLFLLCTDRASRGIDFAGVDCVVLFDFPRDPSEYVRRVGRTARGAGGKGKAFIYVVGKQVSLAQKIWKETARATPYMKCPSAFELMG